MKWTDALLCGVQNGLWDDLTETDELMSTAMSFSGSQLAAKTAASRARKNTDSQTARSTALLMSSANTTCRSYHSQGDVNPLTSINISHWLH